MAPKAKKSSHILLAIGPPPLTYWPENHILAGESISFSFFFFIFKFPFDCWLKCVFCYVNAWVLLWDGFRWKPDVLGGLEICLGLILDDASLKMLKNCFCLCSCMCGLGTIYVALFLHMQVCSWGSAYMGMDLRTRGLVCMCGLWPAYVGHLAEALLLPIFTYFSPFSLSYAILTHFFFFFLSFLHLNITVTFYLSLLVHQNTIFLEFRLNHEPNDILSPFSLQP